MRLVEGTRLVKGMRLVEGTRLVKGMRLVEGMRRLGGQAELHRRPIGQLYPLAAVRLDLKAHFELIDRHAQPSDRCLQDGCRRCV
jgi:hypothetical protein